MRPTSCVEPLRRGDILAALVLAGVLGVTAGLRMHPGACGQLHDDAIYVATAKALAEGDGYRQTFLPGAPPQTKYPPLYPAVLAILWAAWPDFPANLILLEGFTLLCGAGFLATFYLFTVRFGYARRGMALSAGLLCTTSVMFLFFATVTLSETLFALLLVAALWWLEAAVRRPPGSASVDFLGGILLALPFLCRSVGVVLLPLALLRLRQAGRRWRWTTLGAGLAVVPWLFWSTAAWRSWAKDPVEGYYTDYVGWWFSFGPPALVRVLTYNMRWIITAASSLGLDGLSKPLLEADNLAWLLFFGGLGLIMLGTLLADVRAGRFLSTSLAAYLVLISIWPWAPHRFLIPILPFLVVYLLRGLDATARRLVPLAGAGFGVAFLAAALMLNLVGWAQVVRTRHQDDTPNPELGADAHVWSSNQRLFDWLKGHSDVDDVIAAGSDPMVALYTGRRAYYPIVCPPLALFYDLPTPKEKIMEAALAGLARRRPRYLVLTANFHGEREFRAWVADLRERFPKQVVPVYRDAADDRFEVFELRGDFAPDTGTEEPRHPHR